MEKEALCSIMASASTKSSARAAMSSLPRPTAVGGTIAYSFAVAGTPVTARLKVLREVSVENRPQGTIGLFSIAFPLGAVAQAAPPPEPVPGARVVKY